MITTTQQGILDQPTPANHRRGELVRALDQCEKVVAVTWDFDVDGGEADTDIDLDYTTEEACVVTKVVSHEIASVTSGGSATLTLKAGATALTGDVAVASVATGSVTLASSATAIAVAAGQTLKLDIGTADLTAGKVRYYVYMLPQRDMGTSDY